MTRKEFAAAASRIVRLDGATGTELIKRGMTPGVSPELWVCEHPDAFIELEHAYADAGTELFYTPTFGGNELKLGDFGLAERCAEINRSLAEIACRAAAGKPVFGDLAPTGMLIEPNGDYPFEKCVEVYRHQAQALLDGGVAGFAIETMMDLQEVRAALIAVRELTDKLPVIVTMTVEAGGRTMTGCDPVAALAAIQALGADAFGCNCSCGPEEMAEVIRRLKPYAQIPLVAKPNAGMPHLDADGRTRFSLDAESFAASAVKLIDAGANLIGGCCGTSPEHIAALNHRIGRRRPQGVRPEFLRVISSSSRFVRVGAFAPSLLIGERINPTGKKALQAELREGKLDTVLRFAREQERAGSAVLDLNFGLSGINETAMMARAVSAVGKATALPLCFDTTDAETAEAALRLYPGRALFNSISAEKSRLEKLLPVVARYGALPIVLPLTDGGIPETLDERITVLKRILNALREFGYDECEALADALIMTVGANPEASEISLDFIDYCAGELALPTVCGLSNVSFGLPGRAELNRSFLGLALGRGLNAVIANPGAPGIVDQLISTDALLQRDPGLKRYLAHCAATEAQSVEKPQMQAELPVDRRLFAAVLEGASEEIGALIAEALKKEFKPETLVSDILIPALNEVGVRFGRKEIFLPGLLSSAAAMQQAMKLLEPKMSSDAKENGPVVVFASVEGDIHDIGKNIVILLLRNHGFKVIDLGKDVPAARIVEAAKEHHAALIALSALMTTTMPRMKETVELLKKEGLDLPVMIGGAAVDAEYAASIGAGYSGNAAEAVELAFKLTAH